MRAFVTGSTGLLGNNLVRALLAQGYEVRALTRSMEKFQRLFGRTEAIPVLGDIQSIDNFADQLSGCDVVFHTAAYFREYYQSGSHAESLQAINVDATLALIDAAAVHGVQAFVHTSSSGTVGPAADGGPGNEDSPPTPKQLRNLYFRSKHAGNQRIRALKPAQGMRVIEILPGWMFGPGDEGPTAAGQMVLDVLERKLPAIPDGGNCMVDARDVAAAMIAAASHPHGARFLVAGQFHTLRELVDVIASLGAVPPPRFDLPAWFAVPYAALVQQVSHWLKQPTVVSVDGVRSVTGKERMDSSKAERGLGIQFRPLAESIASTIAWYQQTGRVPATNPSSSTGPAVIGQGTPLDH